MKIVNTKKDLYKASFKAGAHRLTCQAVASVADYFAEIVAGNS
jgi:hypothetical protein